MCALRTSLLLASRGAKRAIPTGRRKKSTHASRQHMHVSRRFFLTCVSDSVRGIVFERGRKRERERERKVSGGVCAGEEKRRRRMRPSPRPPPPHGVHSAPQVLLQYDAQTRHEACVLENLWRANVFRCQCVSASLALYHKLPLCLVRHIVLLSHPRRAVTDLSFAPRPSSSLPLSKPRRCAGTPSSPRRLDSNWFAVVEYVG